MDREKFIQHLKSSGIPFTDAELAAEADAAEKDAKAEERRSILNSTKATAPAVAESSPTIAKTAAPVAAAVPAPAVVAAPLTGNAVERVAQNIGQAGTIATNAADNAVQSGDDFLTRHPELYAIPAAYAAHKIAKETGLYFTLGEKIKEKLTSTPAQPQPFVGGAGPRVTSPVTTPTPQPQAWGIHDEPPLFAATSDSLNQKSPHEVMAQSYWDWYDKNYPQEVAPAAVEAPAAPAAAPSRNLTIEEAKARMAGVTPPVASATPSVAPEVAPMAPAAPEPVAAMPARPVVPTPPAALAATAAPAPVPPTGELKTGSGLTAYAGEGKARERFPKEFKSTADIPKGYAFVPGMGAGTNVIRNDFGQAGYNALVQEQGGPFGADKETREFIKKYNEERMGPPATRELRKKLDLPLPENTKGIPMKIAKVGGVVGAIMAIPDLANAAENKDVGQAAQVGASFLPPAMQALIYSGGLNAGAEEEARQLRMRNYAERAGRGVAQSYDPRRLIGVAPPTR